MTISGATLESEPEESEPDADGVLDEAVARAADLLKLAEDEIAGILNQADAPHDPRVLVARLYRSLDSLMGGDDAVSAHWLRAPNAAFDDKPPVEIIKTSDGLMRTIAYLDARRAPV